MWDVLTGGILLGLLWSVMALGVFIAYRIMDLADLTAEGSIALGAAIAARAIHLGVNPYAAVLWALLGGLGAGLITGLVHTRLKIPPLLAGILTMIALYSVNLRIMARANLSLLRMPTIYSLFAPWGLGQFAASVFLAFLVICSAIIILFLFFQTEIGCSLRATGNNPQMARALGINTENMIVLGLMISNGLVALSGALIAQQQSYADVQMGTGSIIIGLASVIIGQVLLREKSILFQLISVVLGSVVYRLVIALVLEMGMPPQDLKLFTAITVALALSLPRLKFLGGGMKNAGNKKYVQNV